MGLEDEELRGLVEFCVYGGFWDGFGVREEVGGVKVTFC